MSDKTQVAVTAGLCLLGALWLLTLPLPWIAAFLCSVAIHELFHILAVKLCGGKIYRIRLKAFGAEIETSPLNWWQEMICTMAGPLSGFALLLFARNFPRIALCGLLHSLYNLLPLFPMDGGG